MNVLKAPFVQGFIRMADDGWQQGWHERNGGNLSYRIREEEIQEIRESLHPGEWREIGTEVPGLSGEYFLVTGSGKFFRNASLDPEDALTIVEIDETGTQYRIVWGLVNGGRPTSELPTHLMNHEVKKAASHGRHRVIYHAHPANIIAMTYTLPLTAKAFSRALWQSATECPVVFPGGVGVVEWMVPGGADIALATSEVMKQFDAAVWAHHGLFCSGPDFDITFGLMHTIEKAAEIYNLVMSSSGGRVLQTISDANLLAIAEEFGVELNKDFLD